MGDGTGTDSCRRLTCLYFIVIAATKSNVFLPPDTCRSVINGFMAAVADKGSYGGEWVVANSSPTERLHGAFKRKTKFSSIGCLRRHRGESRGLRLNALKDRHTYLCRKAWW
jgi:hypothetical protein